MTRINSVIAKCNEQLRKLNADTSNTRPLFKPVAADCQIHVCLATKKPDSAAFNGVIYHSRPNWNSNNDYSAFVSASMLDRTKYLNVFVTPDEEAGVAVFPWEVNNTADGFMVGSKLFGVNEPDMEAWSIEGTTFVHELAHYLGIYHTFHNSSIYLGECELATVDTIGDRCGDTPLDWDFPLFAAQCNDGNRFCNNPNLTHAAQTENYMYYNMDSCTNMFSKDQRIRMRACLDTLRASLISPANLAFTGVSCNPPLSISEPHIDNEFKLYPNPTQGVFYIENTGLVKIEKVNVYNHLGQLVLSKNGNEKIIEIELTNLKSGVYCVLVEGYGKKSIQKIIKQ